MNTAKHTPGPWTVGTDDDTPNIIVEDENGYIISEVRNDGDDKPEQRANAHLIAAAPAMYKALRNLLEVYQDSTDDDGSPAVLSAIDALAQAEGK